MRLAPAAQPSTQAVAAAPSSVIGGGGGRTADEFPPGDRAAVACRTSNTPIRCASAAVAATIAATAATAASRRSASVGQRNRINNNTGYGSSGRGGMVHPRSAGAPVAWSTHCRPAAGRGNCPMARPVDHTQTHTHTHTHNTHNIHTRFG